MRLALGRSGLALVVLASMAAPLGAQDRQSGRIEGVITDSLLARPLAGAAVTAARLDSASLRPLVTTSDERGRFRFDSLGAGEYAVRFTNAMLDSLSLDIHAPRVIVRDGRTSRIALAVPSGATLRLIACPGAVLPSGTGALYGAVTDATTDRPLGGATVLVAWSERVVDPRTRDVEIEVRESSATTDERGEYRFCGPPTAQRLLIQVQRDGRAGAPIEARISDAVGVLVRPLSFSAADGHHLVASARGQGDTAAAPTLSGRAALAGVVRGPLAQPIAGVQLRISSAAPMATSDDSGRYALSGLPAGTHELEIRRIGYGYQRIAVELRSGRTLRHDVRLDRVVSLDSVNVLARRLQLPEFESDRQSYGFGKFLDEEEIARRNFRTLPHIMSTITGFEIAHLPGGRLGFKTTRGECLNVGLVGLNTRPAINVVIDELEFSDVNDVSLADVAAIEAYAIGNEAPSRYRSACAVVVIWTKNWAARRAARQARREPALAAPPTGEQE